MPSTGDASKRKAIVRPKLRRSHARIAVVIAALILGALGVVAGYAYHALHSPQSSTASTVIFVVHPGETVGSVSQRLERRGLIHDGLLVSGSTLFDLDARIQGLSAHLQAGTFTLHRNMTISEMVSTLATADPRTITFTVLPGWRSEQIASELRALGLKSAEFLHAVRHPSFGVPALHVGWPRQHTLEGFLYPDTYSVDPSSTGTELARVMVDRFAQLFSRRMRRQARRQHRSIFRIVTLASIVEREDFLTFQKPLIASVYLNRLRLPRGADGGVGKLLQSDPTVSYALGHNGNWWPSIPGNRTLVHSRFNTYTHYGLPPAPIANPDLSSIRAALHPARTSYHYFASRSGDQSGRLYFAATYQQFCTILGSCS